jgi:transposase
MPPQFVKPYFKSQKNDAADASAIAEAVQRPTMRFVPIKSADQQDVEELGGPNRAEGCLRSVRSKSNKRRRMRCSASWRERG